MKNNERTAFQDFPKKKDKKLNFIKILKSFPDKSKKTEVIIIHSAPSGMIISVHSSLSFELGIIIFKIKIDIFLDFF